MESPKEKAFIGMPETFGPEDTDCPDYPLVVNTGCWVANLRKPWVRAKKEDGSLAASFEFRNRIFVHPNGKLEPQLEPEDWRFSRTLAGLGCKVLATKAIKLVHFGTNGWKSTDVWGEEIDRLADPSYLDRYVNDTGCWLAELPDGAMFDAELAAAIAEIVRGRVVDLGCGRGNYVKALLREGVDAIGLDGNPATATIPHCAMLDLSRRRSLDGHWALSLEVGEHIPSQYEQAYLDNVAACAKLGAIVSWGQPGQPGHGHVNCRPVEWVRGQMAMSGLVLDEVDTWRLRSAATLGFFKSNLQVFRRRA